MANRLPNFQGAMVPVSGPGGEVQWQAWTYGELLRHLAADMDVPDSTNQQVSIGFAKTPVDGFTHVYKEDTFFAPTSMAGWAGGTNFTPAFAYTHGLTTPARASYFTQYINTSGAVPGFTYVSTQTTAGCNINAASVIGAPGPGTIWGVYVLAVLDYSGS